MQALVLSSAKLDEIFVYPEHKTPRFRIHVNIELHSAKSLRPLSRPNIVPNIPEIRAMFILAIDPPVFPSFACCSRFKSLNSGPAGG